MLDFLHTIDLFKIYPNFRIKKSDSISINETIAFSFIFYIVCLVVLIYNFLGVYIDNSPIMQQSEEIRNINDFETIDTSKLKFSMNFFNLKLSLFDAPKIEFLKLKDERIFGIIDNIGNSNFNLSFIPTFNTISYINSKFNSKCNFLKNNDNSQTNSLNSNTYCNEYFDKNITIGGSLLSKGIYLDQQFFIDINLCDFYDLNIENYDSLIQSYKNKDKSQRE